MTRTASTQKSHLGHVLVSGGELGAGQDFTLCKSVFLTATLRQGQDMAEWTLQQRLLEFLLRDRHLPHAPRATTAPQSHSRELRPLPDIPGPPMLYLVRECLPMRTRRSFSVKFLSQGGYRRQWAAVRTQRSLMRLAPQSSS